MTNPWWQTSNEPVTEPYVDVDGDDTLLVGRNIAKLVIGRAHQNVDKMAVAWDKGERYTESRTPWGFAPGDRRGIPSKMIADRRYYHLADLLEFVRARDSLDAAGLEEYVRAAVTRAPTVVDALWRALGMVVHAASPA